MARADQPERPGAQRWVPDEAGVATLRAAAEGCRGCELWAPATQVVFSSGSQHARMMMVGEQPGDKEDEQGEPFVGPAGALLRRAIDEAGIAIDDVYLTNAVKHFRFEQRGRRRVHQKPELGQMVACAPWLEAELQAVDPELIVPLGATAVRVLLGPEVRVTKQRGQLLTHETIAGRRQFVPTVHPSSILRGPSSARHEGYTAFVADLRTASAALSR
ncbi:MAG TPA: UdgX family uracil-DNA binding protein [Actinomycetales bacterium]|nr:UdgX family uracil-DNA binding protein [Actinomycetales bacterium]